MRRTGKPLAFLLAAVMTVSLAACGGNAAKESAQAEPQTSETAEADTTAEAEAETAEESSENGYMDGISYKDLIAQLQAKYPDAESYQTGYKEFLCRAEDQMYVSIRGFGEDGVKNLSFSTLGDDSIYDWFYSYLNLEGDAALSEWWQEALSDKGSDQYEYEGEFRDLHLVQERMQPDRKPVISISCTDRLDPPEITVQEFCDEVDFAHYGNYGLNDSEYSTFAFDVDGSTLTITETYLYESFTSDYFAKKLAEESYYFDNAEGYYVQSIWNGMKNAGVQDAKVIIRIIGSDGVEAAVLQYPNEQ